MSSLCFGLGWTALREGRDPAAERFGDLSLEARVPERPTAIGRRTQAVDEAGIERGSKQRPVLFVSLGRSPADPVKEFVAGQQRINLTQRMRMIARTSDIRGDAGPFAPVRD